ncbi:MAG: Gfo/Idh/MocA family oxidoreductase [Thermomicrobiales bacterium]|nr:Gfo/Idh/MocA family oxidoreductase [Thermomicrobiales bacterium]
MSRIKVGVIGCGAIAQIQHLPHLKELRDQFEVTALSDISAELLAAVGSEFGVPPDRQYLDYHDLIASEIDAVIVCSSGSHAGPSIAAARAGKHVLVEKPMCTTVGEAQEMVAAADETGVVLMVAYMKQYEPAYKYARECVHEMSDIRFIQVNHLHPDNSLHVSEFDVLRFDDIPAGVREASQAQHRDLIAEALGYPDGDAVPPAMQRAYSTILGSMIHDIGNLHGTFGVPKKVLSTEIWAEGHGITTVLAYEDDKRAVCSWVDLPELWEFKETMEVYGSRERVIASFPTGFARGLPSTVAVHGMDAEGLAWRKELSWHDNPFKIELQHFGHCIRTGDRPETDGRSTTHDIALVREIVLAHLNKTEYPHGL